MTLDSSAIGDFNIKGGQYLTINAKQHLSISGGESTYISGRPALSARVLWSGSLTLPLLSSYKPTLTMSESVSNYDFLAVQYHWDLGNRTDIVCVEVELLHYQFKYN